MRSVAQNPNLIPRIPCASGTPGSIVIADDSVVDGIRQVTLGKYADDGNLASWLHIVFDPATGTAVPNGLTVETNPGYRRRGHATSLYRFADERSWGATKASRHSRANQTLEGHAFATSLRGAKRDGVALTDLSVKVPDYPARG